MSDTFKKEQSSAAGLNAAFQKKLDAANAVMGGAATGIPTGTVAQRPIAPPDFTFFGATDIEQLQVYVSGVWYPLAGASNGNPPGPATNLRSTATSPNSASLSWQNPATGAGPFVFSVDYRVSGTTAWTTFTNTQALSATVTGLQAATQYDFQIITAGASPPASLSAIVQVQTASVAPSKPLSVATGTITNTTIATTWATPLTGTAPLAYVAKATAGTTIVQSPPQSGNSYTFTGLSPNTQYTITVTASNNGGSATSDPVTATTAVASTTAPNAPTSLTATNITSSGFTLGWTNSTQGDHISYQPLYGSVSGVSGIVRDPSDQPGSAQSVWNLPVGSGAIPSATTDADQIDLTSLSCSIAYSSPFAVPVWKGVSTDSVITISSPTTPTAATRKFWQNPGEDGTFLVAPIEKTAKWRNVSSELTALRNGVNATPTGHLHLPGDYSQPMWVGTASDPLGTVTDGTKSIQVHLPVGAVIEQPGDGGIGGFDLTQPYLMWNCGTAVITDANGATVTSITGPGWKITGVLMDVSDASGQLFMDIVTGQPGTGNAYGLIQEYDLQQAVNDPNWVMQHMIAYSLDSRQMNSNVPPNNGGNPCWPLKIIDTSFPNSGSLLQGLTVGIPANTPYPAGKAGNRAFKFLWDNAMQFGWLYYNQSGTGCISIEAYPLTTATTDFANLLAAEMNDIAGYLSILDYTPGTAGAQYSIDTQKGKLAGAASNPAFPPPPPLDLSPTAGVNISPSKFGAWYPSGYNVTPSNTPPAAANPTQRDNGLTAQVHCPANATIGTSTDALFTIFDKTQPNKVWSGTGCTYNNGTNVAGGITCQRLETDLTCQTMEDATTGNYGYDSAIGLIRNYDLAQGKINHVLQWLADASLMSGTPAAWDQSIAWPDTHATNGRPGYTGHIQPGATIYIPASVNLDSVGLTQGGLILAKGIQQFGAIWRGIATGGVTFRAEQNIDSQYLPLLQQMKQDCPKILPLLRIMRNQGPNSKNGGGTPLVQLPPPLDIGICPGSSGGGSGGAPSSFTPIGQPTTTNSENIVGLQPNTKYAFEVMASNSLGNATSQFIYVTTAVSGSGGGNPGPVTKWNTTAFGGPMTFSSDSLTAFSGGGTASGAAPQGCISTTGKTTGMYWFEIIGNTLYAPNGAVNAPIGLYAGNPGDAAQGSYPGFNPQWDGFVSAIGRAPTFWTVYMDQTYTPTDGTFGWTQQGSYFPGIGKGNTRTADCIPVFAWPFGYKLSGQSAVNLFTSISNGSLDTTIKDTLINWKTGGYSTLYIRPAWEFNLPNNYAVNSTNLADFIAAWKHFYTLIHTTAAANGMTVKIIWNPNVGGNQNSPALTVAQQYPGDAYVDLYGIDTYGSPVDGAHTPGATTTDPTQYLVTTMINMAVASGKAVCFPEVGGIDTAFATAMVNYLETNPGPVSIEYFGFWDIDDSNGNLSWTNASDNQATLVADWKAGFGPSGQDFALGLANASFQLTSGGGLGADANGIGYYPVSPVQSVYYNGTSLTAGNADPDSNGAVFTVIADIDGEQFWVTSPAMRAAVGAGAWNNSLSANPATKSGGISFSGLTGTKYICFNNLEGGSAATINTGSVAPSVTIPSGVSPWDPAPSGPPSGGKPTLTGPGLETVAVGATVNVQTITVADSSATGTCTLAMACSKGTLTATVGGSPVSGSGTTSISFSNTLGNCQAVAATLVYTAGSSTGSDNISVSFSDNVGQSATLNIPVTITASTAPKMLPPGPLSALGAQIVDQNGNPVRICSVGWDWYEGPTGIPRGLDTISYKTAFQSLVNAGINTVRIGVAMASVNRDDPFPNSGTGQFFVRSGKVIAPNGTTWSGRGVNILEGNDTSESDVASKFSKINVVRFACYTYPSTATLAPIVQAFTSLGIVVVLENHFNNAGNAGGSQGQIFTGQTLTTEQNWYKSIASYFANNPYVWFGTNNEPSETDSNGNNNPAALSSWQQTTYNTIRNAGNNSPILIETIVYVSNSSGQLVINGGFTANVYAAMHNVIWDQHLYGGLTAGTTASSIYNQIISGLNGMPSADGVMPIFIGEYGDSQDGQNIDSNASDCINTVQSYVANGTFAASTAWAFANFGGADSLLDGSGNLSSYGQTIATFVGAGSGPGAYSGGSAGVNINYSLNPDLSGLKFNEALQTVVAYGRSIGLRFIIDWHNQEGTNTVNFGANTPNGLWYDVGGASNGTDLGGNTGTISQQTYIDLNTKLATMFKNSDALIGIDLLNSPGFGRNPGSTWGGYTSGSGETGVVGGNRDIRKAYQDAGNAALAVNPNLLIICEGVQDSTTGASYAPEGAIQAAKNWPVVLNVKNKLVYSGHIYPTEVTGATPDSGTGMFTRLNTEFGWLYTNNQGPPYWVSECGDNMRTTDGTTYMNDLISYLNGNQGANGGPTFTSGQQGIGWDWWNFDVVKTTGVPNFGLLSTGGGGIDQTQLGYINKMLFTTGAGTGTGQAPLITAPLAGPVTTGTWEYGDFQSAGMPHGSMHYALLKPHGYSSANSYPVLVYQHQNNEGNAWYQNGGDPTTNTIVFQDVIDGIFNSVAFRTDHPAIILVPFCDQTDGLSGGGLNFGGYNDTVGQNVNMNAVCGIVQHIWATLSCYQPKTFVTGQSLGGTGTIAQMLDFNRVNGPSGKIWAAGLCLSGQIVRSPDPSTDPTILARMASVPLFCVAGSGDNGPGTGANNNAYERPVYTHFSGSSSYPAPPGAQGGSISGCQAGTSSYYYAEDTTLGHNTWSGNASGHNYGLYPGDAKPFIDWLFAQEVA